MRDIKTVHIVGMGALGLLFGAPIAEYLGSEQPVYLMNEDRVARHSKETWTINEREIHPVMQTPETAGAKGTADLILVGVKYPGLQDALDLVGPSVGEDTIIISMMNGIDSEEILGERFGEEKVVYAIAQGMDAQRYGSALSYTQPGKLHLGVPAAGEDAASQEIYTKRMERLETVCRFFDAAKVPYIREEDILYRQWSKFMLNVGCNQACMVYDAPYGKALEHGSEAFAMMVGGMREVCAVAQAKGIQIGEKEISEYIELEHHLNPNAIPSMGQDRRQRHYSEVEMFAGIMIRMGKELGIEVPVNEFLYRRVKEIEAEY